jgi:tRNA(Ile2)-agmatinylcytidine synthase
MCTTYLGAVLVRRLEERQLLVTKASLIRLNPNVKFKTRGNAAICIEAEGDPKVAFATACGCVEELAEFDAAQTEPGVVVAEQMPPVEFYERAVRDFCTIPEALDALEACGALYRGYKGGRGLIGATAAVACELADATFERLAYRDPAVRTAKRNVDRDSLFLAEERTYPRTWDTVDRENGLVVCVPHTADPVLFGIRGATAADVAEARSFVRSETPAVEQTYVTNQGTDAHLVPGRIGALEDGRSYWVAGTVAAPAVTAKGGHVAVFLTDSGGLRTPRRDVRDPRVPRSRRAHRDAEH